MKEKALQIGILILSDRASAGIYQDRGGPAVIRWLKENISSDFQQESLLIPDHEAQLLNAFKEWVSQNYHLIITTGGTGPSPTDITPDVTSDYCDKLLPGFSERMRSRSIELGIPTAILSRQVVGIKEQSLIVNLPGSPNAIKDCLDSIAQALPYCIELIGGPLIDLNPELWSAFWPKSSRHHQGKN